MQTSDKVGSMVQGQMRCIREDRLTYHWLLSSTAHRVGSERRRLLRPVVDERTTGEGAAWWGTQRFVGNKKAMAGGGGMRRLGLRCWWCAS